MEVDSSTGDDSLSGGVHDIKNSFRTDAARTERMRWIDAHRHARETPDHRRLGEIHKVAVRIAHARFDAAQSEHHFAIPFAGQIFGGMERLAQRDAKAALEQNRKFLLAANQEQRR